MSIEIQNKFEPGNVVILVSGGALMTVEFVDAIEYGVVRTVWFKESEVMRDAFDTISLVKIKS